MRREAAFGDMLCYEGACGTRLSCLGNRKIRFYKQVGQVQNPSVDKLIATDTSERNGDHGE
jgi:hypothetical protein